MIMMAGLRAVAINAGKTVAKVNTSIFLPYLSIIRS